jgi:hypothetical protein
MDATLDHLTTLNAALSPEQLGMVDGGSITVAIEVAWLLIYLGPVWLV